MLPKIKTYIETNYWSHELQELRAIVLQSKLVETFKWKFPVYTWNNKNIVGLGTTKKTYGLWFFQGATLSDPLGVLVNAQEGKTQAMRHWRFSKSDTLNKKPILEYIHEAIENQKLGNIVIFKKEKVLVIPPLLKDALSQNPQDQASFDSFSKSKQIEFAKYISVAKREDTKTIRLHRILPLIRKGIGLNDKYKTK